MILDWPATELRFQHWDTKHHQDRLEVLKRYIDWSARFKFNMIGFELEDKFSYPSHPVIGAPGAFTPEQLQEIVDYALERHIQVVPQIQSPAHMAYVLKHPEFSNLRSDGSNYQICLCNEESYQLVFDMYQDVIDATKGVDYFHVSTDEVYYAGICQRCERPYNAENRSLAWVEFVQRAYKFLSERGRKMLVWLEYPVLPEHVSLLPLGIIDGVWGNSYVPDRMPSLARRQYLEAEERSGIQQLAYVAIGSSDYMIFPRYFSEASRKGRLELMMEQLNNVISTAKPLGVYGAFWNDTGRHCEIYWMGKATVAQYAWTPGKPSLEQTAVAFCKIYYGDSVDPVRLLEIYSGLQEQSRFFQKSWDLVDSRELKP
ncbi:MAG: family 20 glycosylhydrolase, partial [bacterium]